MLIPPGVAYHQKGSLVHGIRRYIDVAGSLLDIGAGSPETALPFSAIATSYTAIERAAKAAADLRRAGLSVMEGSFPDVRPEGTFDVVLACHSLPATSSGSWAEFLAEAWKLARPGGQLLVVTFLGARGELYGLRQEVLGRAPDGSRELAELAADLDRLGPTRQKRLNSYVESADANGIAEFLLPWGFGGPSATLKVIDGIVDALEWRFRVRDGLYVFPIEHVVLNCVRP